MPSNGTLANSFVGINRKIFFMLDNLDELIELNLKLLYNSPNKYIWRINFRNEK